MSDTVTDRMSVRNPPVGKRPADDPVLFLERVLTAANTAWLRWTYPFVAFGRKVSIHYMCDIRRSSAAMMSIGDNVYLAQDVWLNVPEYVPGAAPVIVLGTGCRIGRRCMITARNSVRLEEDVLLGPSILIADHSHEFSGIDTPIHTQGLTAGGTVLVEKNVWLGYGAAVVCNSGHLVIGRNSVVGANAVVTASVPPFCAVAGNPARIVKRYDPEAGKWVKASFEQKHAE